MQRHYFSDKSPSSQSYSFSSSYVWMWELDYKESWTLENWCFWTEVLENTLESPFDCKEIQPVHAGKYGGQEEKGMTEDEMVGWHHWLNQHKFQQGPRLGDGQGSLACCSPWSHKESDMTEQLNWMFCQSFIYLSIFLSGWAQLLFISVWNK